MEDFFHFWGPLRPLTLDATKSREDVGINREFTVFRGTCLILVAAPGNNHKCGVGDHNRAKAKQKI